MLAGFAIAGTPAACTEQIIALCQQTGAYSLRALFSANGLIPLREARAAMTLFANDVLPVLTVGDVTAQPKPATDNIERNVP